MVGRANEAAQGRTSFSMLYQDLSLIANSVGMPRSQVGAALSEGWNSAVDILLEDHLPTREEETRLSDYLKLLFLYEATVGHRRQDAYSKA